MSGIGLNDLLQHLFLLANNGLSIIAKQKLTR